MKKIISVLALSLIFLGCEDQSQVLVEKKETIFSAPTSIKSVSNHIWIQTLKSKISTSGRLSSSTLAFGESKEVMFEGKDIVSIVTPIKTNTGLETNLLAYITPEGEISDVLLVNEIELVTKNTYISTYSTVEGVVLYTVKVDNGAVTFLNQKIDASGRTAAVPCPAAKWAKCVAAVAEQMTDGSVFGSVSFVACIAFSGFCAAGLTVSCAIMGVGICSQ